MLKTPHRPLVSLILPVFNEAVILEENLTILCNYLKTIEHKYSFQLVIVNDGSTDSSGEIIERFSQSHNNVTVCHHLYNFRLGQALRTGIERCTGEYIIVLDIDLSYAPEHIERIMYTLTETGSEVVVASPYMKGGQVSNVPWLRKQLSYWANKFLALTATRDHLCNISTLTGMTRGYDAKFLKALSLKAMDVDINTEILYKSMILRARILEVPAHLSWRPQENTPQKRKSSLHIFKAIISSLISGFTFRPFMFFILPGFLLFLLSLYPLIWLLIHTISYFGDPSLAMMPLLDKLSEAISLAFTQSPHAFIVGGFNLLVAIQLMTLGFLALQKKKYFEELFHITSMIKQQVNSLPSGKEGTCNRIINRCKRSSKAVESEKTA